MSTFVDARAAALGITGPLTDDQRIELDRNAQLEKLGVTLSHITNAALRDTLWATQVEWMRLTNTAYRQQAGKQVPPLDYSKVPVAPTV